MKRTFLTALFALSLATIIGITPFAYPADAPQEEPGKVKVSGEVQYYSPGKRLDIGIRPQVDKSYDLSSRDTRYEIDPGLQIGSMVDVEETKDSNGQKVITVRVKPKK